MSDVFISYSRKDIAFARLLQESLQQSQIDTWIDWERIPVGERWWDEICRAIENANVFMFIISSHSIGSSVCKQEIEHALKNNKRIIPLILDELTTEAIQEFAPDLPKFNWIIFEKDRLFRIEENPQVQSDKPEDRQVALPKAPQYAEALEKLGKAIHTDWEWVKVHTRLQVDALRWENNRRDAGYLVRGAALEEAEGQLLRASGKEPQPTGLQVEYVTASRKEETSRQNEKLALEQKARGRQRLVIWAVTIGLVAAIGLGAAAWGQRNQAVSQGNLRATAEANAVAESHVRATAQVDAENAKATAQANATEAERQASLAISSGLAAQTRNYLDTQYDLSLLLAVEALNVADTYAARDSLITALQKQPHLKTFLRTAEVYTDLALSPDGNTLAGAYCSEKDKSNNCLAYEVQFWDIPSRQPAGSPVSGVKGPLRYMADGENLIVRQMEGQFALLDVQTRQVTDLPFANPGYAPRLVLSPDGRLLAVAGCSSISFPSGLCGGAYLQVLNFADGKLLYETEAANTYYPDSLAFSPDGNLLVYSGCEVRTDEYGNRECVKGNLSAWDVNSGTVSTHPIDADTTLLSLAFKPDGRQLAVGNNDGTLIFYETTSWQEVNRRLESDNSVEGLVYRPDGTSLISSSSAKPILLWDLETAQRIDEINILSYSRSTTLLDAGGTLLAESGCYQYNNTGFVCLQGVVLLWDVSPEPSLGHAYVKINNSDWRNSQFLSPDGKMLALTECTRLEPFNELNEICVAGEIRVVDTLSGALIGEPITGLPSEINAAAFSPDGNQLVSVTCSQHENLLCVQSRIDWWNISTGAPRGAPILVDNWILNILLGPDGTTLYFDGQNDTIERLNLETGQPAGTPLEGFGLNQMAFSPDGQILATAGCMDWNMTCLESEVVFWDTQTWQRQGDPISLVFDEIDVSAFGVSALMFSPEGNRIAIATKSSIRFWDLEQAQFQELTIPVYNMSSMAFNRAGDTLAVYSMSSNGTGSLFLWDLNKAQPMGSSYPVDGKDRNQFVFSLDDTLLIGNSGIAWDVDPLSWQQRACQVANRNFTSAEWKVFMEDRPYQKTCPDLP
jgi:WD40 repeat protein